MNKKRSIIKDEKKVIGGMYNYKKREKNGSVGSMTDKMMMITEVTSMIKTGKV